MREEERECNIYIYKYIERERGRESEQKDNFAEKNAPSF